MGKKRGGVCPECGKNHFGLCHKCPHAGERETKWRTKRWEETPCAACALSTDGRAAGHGRGLSLEHVPARMLPAVQPEVYGEEAAGVMFMGADPRGVVERLLRFFRAYMTAKDEQAAWMRDALRGIPSKAVAERDGITAKQASRRRSDAMRLMGWKWNETGQEWVWDG